MANAKQAMNTLREEVAIALGHINSLIQTMRVTANYDELSNDLQYVHLNRIKRELSNAAKRLWQDLPAGYIAHITKVTPTDAPAKIVKSKVINAMRAASLAATSLEAALTKPEDRAEVDAELTYDEIHSMMRALDAAQINMSSIRSVRLEIRPAIILR